MTIIRNVFYAFLLGFFLLGFQAYGGDNTTTDGTVDPEPVMCDETQKDGTVVKVPCPEPETPAASNDGNQSGKDLSEVMTVAASEGTDSKTDGTDPAPVDPEPVMCDETQKDGTVVKVPCPEPETPAASNDGNQSGKDLSEVMTVAASEGTDSKTDGTDPAPVDPEPVMCDETQKDGTVVKVPCPEPETPAASNDGNQSGKDLSEVMTVAASEGTDSKTDGTDPAPVDPEPVMCDETQKDGTVVKVPCPEPETPAASNDGNQSGKDLSEVMTVAASEGTDSKTDGTDPAPVDPEPVMCDETQKDGTVVKVPCPEPETPAASNDGNQSGKDLSEVMTVAASEGTDSKTDGTDPAPVDPEPVMCDETQKDGTVVKVPCPEPETPAASNDGNQSGKDLSEVMTVAASEGTDSKTDGTDPAPVDPEPVMCDETQKDGTVVKVPCPEPETPAASNDGNQSGKDLSEVMTVAASEGTDSKTDGTDPAPVDPEPVMCDETQKDGTVVKVPCPEPETPAASNDGNQSGKDLSEVMTVAASEGTDSKTDGTDPAPVDPEPVMCDETQKDGTVVKVPCPEPETPAASNDGNQSGKDLSEVMTVAASEGTDSKTDGTDPAPVDPEPVMCDETQKDGTVVKVPCPEPETPAASNDGNQSGKDLSEVMTVAASEGTDSKTDGTDPAPVDPEPVMCDETQKDGTVVKVPCPEPETPAASNDGNQSGKDLSEVMTVAASEGTDSKTDGTDPAPVDPEPVMCDETQKDGTVVKVPCPEDSNQSTSIQRELIDRVSTVIDSYQDGLTFEEINEGHFDSKNVRLFVGEEFFDVHQNALRKTVIRPEGKWIVYPSSEELDETTVLFSYDGHTFGATHVVHSL